MNGIKIRSWAFITALNLTLGMFEVRAEVDCGAIHKQDMDDCDSRYKDWTVYDPINWGVKDTAWKECMAYAIISYYDCTIEVANNKTRVSNIRTHQHIGSRGAYCFVGASDICKGVGGNAWNGGGIEKDASSSEQLVAPIQNENFVEESGVNPDMSQQQSVLPYQSDFGSD